MSPLVDRNPRILDLGSAGNFAVIRLFCCDFIDEEWSEGFEHDNGDFLQVRVFHAFEPLFVIVTIDDGREILLKGPCARSQRLCQDVDLEEEKINDIDGTGVHFFNLKQLRNIIEDRKCEGNFRMHISVHDTLNRKTWCLVPADAKMPTTRSATRPCSSITPTSKAAGAQGHPLIPPWRDTQLYARSIPQPSQLNLMANNLPAPPPPQR